MKRLHKIALSVVALVAVMISGCGADEKNAPVIENLLGRESTYIPGKYEIMIIYRYNENKKKNIRNVVYFEGKHPCKILEGEPYGQEHYRMQLEDCPPKDRLNTQSYKFKVQTRGGKFFCYEGNSTKNEATGLYIHRISCDK